MFMWKDTYVPPNFLF